MGFVVDNQVHALPRGMIALYPMCSSTSNPRFIRVIRAPDSSPN